MQGRAISRFPTRLGLFAAYRCMGRVVYSAATCSESRCASHRRGIRSTHLINSSTAPSTPRESSHPAMTRRDSAGGPFALLIIDPQVDFHSGGSLAVPGADEDAARIAAFIRANLDRITSIYVTLDTHQRMHISHGLFWRGPDGAPPPPFTVITHADARAGRWTPVNPEQREAAETYLRRLEEEGRMDTSDHTIWPEHCLIGSPGHCVVPPILDALHAWSAHAHKPVDYTWKGTNPMAEMYSAFKAEVPVPGDPSTEMNMALVEKLKAEPCVRVCGQALSHCVYFSMRDLLSVWPRDRARDLILLQKMTSPVPGFEMQGQQYKRFLTLGGMRLEPSPVPR